MAATYKYPDRTINYRVYLEGENLVGVATVDLPEISYLTESLTGAGIAGNIETPLLGHFDTMTATLNFHTPNASLMRLLEASGHQLVLRSAHQHVDSASNELGVEAIKITMRTLPKTVTMGSLESNASSDSSIELEITYLKIERDDVEELEIDKLNFKCTVGGVSVFDKVAAALGM